MKQATPTQDETLYNFLMEKAYKGQFLTPREELTLERIENKVTYNN